jgi:hypothetical protein
MPSVPNEVFTPSCARAKRIQNGGILYAEGVEKSTRCAGMQHHSALQNAVPYHGLAGSADSGFSCVIASRGKMVDAMGFCMELAERAQQAHSIVW